MIGERLRKLRHEQQLSLNDVASRAKISAATLSRIENEKQALAIDMLFALAGILSVAPEDLVAVRPDGDRSENENHLAEKIAALRSSERARLWRQLAAYQRAARARRRDKSDAAGHIEELLAQVDFLRQEIESVRLGLRKR